MYQEKRSYPGWEPGRVKVTRYRRKVASMRAKVARLVVKVARLSLGSWSRRISLPSYPHVYQTQANGPVGRLSGR